MEIKPIEPSEFAQEMTRQIVKQNERIIEMNATLLQILQNPMMIYKEPTDNERP